MSKLEIRDLSYTLEILREKEQEKAHRARKAAERKARMEAYHEIEFDSSMAQLQMGQHPGQHTAHRIAGAQGVVFRLLQQPDPRMAGAVSPQLADTHGPQIVQFIDQPGMTTPGNAPGRIEIEQIGGPHQDHIRGKGPGHFLVESVDPVQKREDIPAALSAVALVPGGSDKEEGNALPFHPAKRPVHLRVPGPQMGKRGRDNQHAVPHGDPAPGKPKGAVLHPPIIGRSIVLDIEDIHAVTAF